MDRDVYGSLLADGALDRLSGVAAVDTALLITDFEDPAHTTALASAEVLFTHWGCPPLTGPALQRMPRLRAVVHAAGSVKQHITDAVWQRGIVVSTAAQANAQPVAEYTLAAILFANKRVLESAQSYRTLRNGTAPLKSATGLGNYQRTVGIVGASRIGRLVIELLRPFDLTVLVYDPHLDPEEARELGAETVGLDELTRRGDVVSLHAPQLPQTHQMFGRRRLGLLGDGATLINTARGTLVDTEALTRELVSGRIYAVIDVTDPEVLPADSPLYDLPNVLLTPHIAGSLGHELGRMADAAIAELARYARGLPFRHAVDPGTLTRSA
ncbi:hydroxyacid dehydrogenase [Streptomyces gobiensis]|uniref:hydroxyacid dehydrogenase n=1 Tax=Streptomyces gobiensis TaxID=2875706 RepID=UPI001E46D8A7|nr:hydroxyacid dehydrogenase [Streptomyces gobiensis]UGY95275.1 hydroxyacid dehydrogenase [Streptomyces gobiensis]